MALLIAQYSVCSLRLDNTVMNDHCIRCGKEIKNDPVTNRTCFIEGVGPYCDDCYNELIIPTDNPAVTIMHPDAPMPDISDLKPHIHGMAYLIEEGLADDGVHKRFSFHQCALFNSEETEEIKAAADVLGRFFTNLNRFEGVKESYQEFKDELQKMDERSGKITVDRRFRAYIMEWKLFIDHFEFFIKSGAQTKHWEDDAWKETYLRAFQKYFDDVTHEAFDSNDSYKLAQAVRNHVSHAYDAVDWINYVRRKVYIDRDKVIGSLNKGIEQRKALERQEKKIDLEWLADECLKVLTEVYEKLMNFLVLDLEVIPAVNVMLNANKRIEEAEIKATHWMICEFGEMEWRVSETQFVTLTRVADENGNSIDPPEEIKLPQMVPGAKMEYRSLNWPAYLGLAGLIGRLHRDGLWIELEKKYFGYEPKV